MWIFIIVFIIAILGTIIGSRYSIHLFKTNHPKKFLPFGIAFLIAVLSEIFYFILSKHNHLSLDQS